MTLFRPGSSSPMAERYSTFSSGPRVASSASIAAQMTTASVPSAFARAATRAVAAFPVAASPSSTLQT